MQLSDRAEKVLEKELLRPDEVMALANISRRQVYNMIERGDLQCTRAFGPLRVFSASVRALISSCDMAPGA